MTWFKVCDGIAFHRKTLKAGNEAMGAWVRAGAWSSAPENLTDGWIPPEVADQIAPPKVWAKLRAAGFVEEPSDGRSGHQFHDFLVYNPPASEVRERREDLSRKRSEAGRKGNEKRWGERRKEDAEPSQQDRKTVATESQADRPDPDPDPDPGSSAPTERAKAEPSPPPPVVSRPEPGPDFLATEGAQGQLALGTDAPKVIPSKPSPQNGRQKPPAPKAETPNAIGWRTWRIAYQAKYRRTYPKGGPSGKAMLDIAKAAAEYLQELERDPGDLEALFKHWWRRYLADPGVARSPGRKGFLDESNHALQFFLTSVAAYGSPWDRGAQPPARAAPREAEQIIPALPPPGLAKQVSRAGLGGTGEIIARPVAPQEGAA